MPTSLSTDEMKAKVRSHFEDFVNHRKPEVIRTNMTPDFYDHDGPGEEPTDASGDEQMMRQMYCGDARSSPHDRGSDRGG